MSTWLLIFGLAAVFNLLYYDYRQFRDKAEAEDRYQKTVWKQEEQERINALAEDSRTRRTLDQSLPVGSEPPAR